MPSRSFYGFLIVAAILASPFAAAIGWNAWYDRSNEMLAGDVLLYPGARPIGEPHTTAIGIRQRERSLTFRLPPNTQTTRIERFLRRQLDSRWRELVRIGDGWCFTRGEAAMLLRTGNVNGAHLLWTMVDARGADRCTDHPFFNG